MSAMATARRKARRSGLVVEYVNRKALDEARAEARALRRLCPSWTPIGSGWLCGRCDEFAGRRHHEFSIVDCSEHDRAHELIESDRALLAALH